MLENAARPYPDGMCKLTKNVRDAPDEPQLVDIYFKNGAPGEKTFLMINNSQNKNKKQMNNSKQANKQTKCWKCFLSIYIMMMILKMLIVLLRCLVVRVGLRAKCDYDEPVGSKDVQYAKEETEPLAAFLLLNEIAREHGVGRIDIVENRFVGIKSRGVYETPGGTLLFEAHSDLEGLVLDREVRRVRDSLAHEYSRVVYNGLWHSPEMELLDAVRRKSQDHVDGIVCMSVFKGQALALARTSEKTLYDEKLSSMDEEGGFVPSDSTGFIAIQAIRLKAAAARTAKELAVPLLNNGEMQLPIT